MKVGIMSMQRVKNYGSFLQAYSMQKNIEAMGHEVVFVDFHVEPCLYDPTARKSLKTIAKDILRPAFHRLRRIRRSGKEKDILLAETNETILNAGLRELNMTQEPSYNTEADVLIIGSDEVFNCLQAGKGVGYSPELFGRNNRAHKLVSYAASFGDTTYKRLQHYGIKDEIAGMLSKFDSLSVRDKNSGNTVWELLRFEPYYHLDPVFIWDYEEEMKSQPAPPFDHYIIVYAYPKRISAAEGKSIKNCAKRMGKKILCLCGTYDFADMYLPAEPYAVLNYFRHADAVITDTFHGTVFSIKYNIPFVTLVRERGQYGYGNAEKLNDLLERFSFDGRKITDPEQIEFRLKQSIDFDDANSYISKEKYRSRKYLESIISSSVP